MKRVHPFWLSIFLAACSFVPGMISAPTERDAFSLSPLPSATQSPILRTPSIFWLTSTPTQTPIPSPTLTRQPVDIVLSDRLTLHESGYVVSYLVAPQEFDHYLDLMATESVTQVIRETYAFFKDDFDFVFVINNAEKDFSLWGNGITFALRPYPETGLGALPTFEDGLPYVKISTPLESETQRLMTMIHFAHKHAIRKGPVLHEMMHRWGNFILPVSRSYNMHWGFASIGGQLGGFTEMESRENETFYAYNRLRPDKCFGPTTPSQSWDTRNSIPYASLELYLMGLIGMDEVPPEITVLEGGRFVDNAPCIVSGIPHIYKTKELLQPARQPSVADSQKHFKVLTIVVTSSPLTEAEWEYFVQQLRWFEYQGDDNDASLYNFWEATGGRASVELGELAASLSPLPSK